MWLNVPMPSIKISYSSENLKADAEALAAKLGLGLQGSSGDEKVLAKADYLLTFKLSVTSIAAPSPIDASMAAAMANQSLRLWESRASSCLMY